MTANATADGHRKFFSGPRNVRGRSCQCEQNQSYDSGTEVLENRLHKRTVGELRKQLGNDYDYYHRRSHEAQSGHYAAEDS